MTADWTVVGASVRARASSLETIPKFAAELIMESIKESGAIVHEMEGEEGLPVYKAMFYSAQELYNFAGTPGLVKQFFSANLERRYREYVGV